ncbi:Cof-type HAD-IIB family hydrolase [Paenibacillus sp. BSR1-1]|uniref:Cof-type HAD-IIB family hydrolase n=1 Tax=Paenibacillus sp. BSR1-1 TaxID=3020845 RepID=UPI0025B07173|nr:Cof-type HAD-IIB family hydrolase [Paenibacillus sp. BSR1-1]MDN3017946.1 Cof-type HAD-IIB family hydrolase [Paenibacillus sp. BSR1-1]
MTPYKIVFFDIDGTLITVEGQIPYETKESIDQLKESNVKIVIATGRAPYHLKPIAEELGIDSYVSFNGSYVVFEGKPIVDEPFPTNSVQLLVEFAQKNNHPLVYLGNEDYYASYHEHPDIIETFQWLKVAPPNFDSNFWKGNSIYQVVLCCDSHEENKYHQNFSDIKFIRSYKQSIDVIPSEYSKASGIESILRFMGISPSEAVAFGDGLNDREMLSYVGMGIAMGNAHAELKPIANFVTKNVNNRGIQFGLKKIGLI